MGNIKYGTGIFYMQNENGETTPLGNISDVKIEQSSLADDALDELITAFVKISEATLTADIALSLLRQQFLIFGEKSRINNWRKNHGLPLIRRRNRR